MIFKLLPRFNKLNDFSVKYPVLRGMISYGTVWPTGCFLQQIIAGDEEFDYQRAARFFLFGCFYVAPTISVWLHIARKIWPRNDIKSSITKVIILIWKIYYRTIWFTHIRILQAVVEQVSYTPFAMVSFYTGMSLLEGKNLQEAKEEVQAKFLPTYKVRLLFFILMHKNILSQPFN